jgi:hypothetical protein
MPSPFLQSILNMVVFNGMNIQTSNPIINTIFSAFALLFVNKITEMFSEWNNVLMYRKITSYFFKPNSIIVNGKCCSGMNKYDTFVVVSSTFSDRFRSLFFYIYNNIQNIQTICEVMELKLSNNIHTNADDIFIISQENPFIINQELQIYVKIFINKEKTETTNKTEKKNMENMDIEIVIFSYKSSISILLEFVEKIKTDYLANIEKNRIYSKFIYTLEKTKMDDCILDCWSETEFKTTRSFDNMFFEGKRELVDEIMFFQNNEKWYYEKGIPYTLGIGLCGPPGTGKTSVIKSVAKMLDRHIIVLSLKIIKTRKQLNEFFFEKRYNYENKKNSITFDKKTIIIEDIDCIGDIVKERSIKEAELEQKKLNKKSASETELIKSILENVEDSNSKTCAFLPIPLDEEPITLDDILNLWDGIRETPGRVLIISSNHYDKLDSALIRPGRIDFRLELSYVSHRIISEFYMHFFGKEMDPEKLSKIKENLYTPCEITNIYIKTKHNEHDFMERLMLNERVKTQ